MNQESFHKNTPTVIATIIVTGVTGFLGSALVRSLLANNYQVIGIKRTTSDLSRIMKEIKHPHLHLVNIDQIDPSEIFFKNRIDAIIHTATEYGRRDTPIYKILQANLILPIRLAELGIKNGTQLFINTDSYFNKNNNSYSHLLNYSLSKKSLLTWLNQISKKLKIINAVLEHIYGPYDSTYKFTESLIQEIAIQKKSLIPLTHGHQKRDFIYLDDAVEAYLKILDYGLKNNFRFKQFEIGTGSSTEISEMAKIIKNISQSPSELGFGKLPYRSDEIMESVADNQELVDLDWAPKVNLKDGITKILKLYKIKAY